MSMTGLGRVSSVLRLPALAASWLLLASLALVLAPAPALSNDTLGHKRPRGVNLVPLYALTTHTGDALARGSLRGRPFVIAFGYTNCPDVCPTTLLDLTNHLAELGPDADRLKVLFVTVDPERDTVAHLATYMRSFDPRIVGLTGADIEIASVAHALDAFYERGKPNQSGGYSVDHTLKVAFFDRYGLLAARLDLVRTPHERVREVLRRLLAQ